MELGGLVALKLSLRDPYSDSYLYLYRLFVSFLLSRVCGECLDIILCLDRVQGN
jgi:hypothetical protein